MDINETWLWLEYYIAAPQKLVDEFSLAALSSPLPFLSSSKLLLGNARACGTFALNMHVMWLLTTHFGCVLV